MQNGLCGPSAALLAILMGLTVGAAQADTNKRPAPADPRLAAELAAKREFAPEAKYCLPWPGRVTVPVYQGNFGTQTHLINSHNHYAWDFGMPPGDVVCAARSGVVYRVLDTGSAIGDRENIIEVLHDDGEISVYSHIKTGSAKVKRKDRVQAGQPIAQVGDMNHLHFVVWDKDHQTSIPSGFREVKEKGGVPQDQHTYTSQAPLITAKTMAEGMKHLLHAEGLLVEGRTAVAIPVLQKLAEGERIAGNDRARAGELLAGLGKEGDEALAAARARFEAREWKDAKALAQEVARKYAGLAAAESARALLREIEKAVREQAKAGKSGKDTAAVR